MFDGVAPYVVFPDTALIGFATVRATSETEMLSISGVGVTKFARYGEQIYGHHCCFLGKSCIY